MSTTLTSRPRSPRRRALALACVAAAATLTLGACGGDSDASTDGSAQQQGGQQQGGPTGSGLVAAVDGSTAQVQSGAGQVAVTWTDATTFTQQVDATLSDVSDGSCVVVTSAEDDSSGSDDSGADTVAAGTVRISEAADDGTCTAGMGGPSGSGGQPPSGEQGGDQEGGAPEGMPSERPSDAPEGTDGGPGRMGGFAVGVVSDVTDSGFTVTGTSPSRGGDSDEAEETTTQVTVSSTTTYTTTEEATADDVQVGVCVTSQGESDDTGAVTAATIAISPATDGECSGGFGGGPGRGQGGDEGTQ